MLGKLFLESIPAAISLSYAFILLLFGKVSLIIDYMHGNFSDERKQKVFRRSFWYNIEMTDFFLSFRVSVA